MNNPTQNEIDETHPMNGSCGDRELAADAIAMELVGDRHDKRDLVNLVRYLLLQKNEPLKPNTLEQRLERLAEKYMVKLMYVGLREWEIIASGIMEDKAFSVIEESPSEALTALELKIGEETE